MAEILHILDSFIIFGQEELHNTFVLYKYCIFKDLSILGALILSLAANTSYLCRASHKKQFISP